MVGIDAKAQPLAVGVAALFVLALPAHAQFDPVECLIQANPGEPVPDTLDEIIAFIEETGAEAIEDVMCIIETLTDDESECESILTFVYGDVGWHCVPGSALSLTGPLDHKCIGLMEVEVQCAFAVANAVRKPDTSCGVDELPAGTACYQMVEDGGGSGLGFGLAAVAGHAQGTCSWGPGETCWVGPTATPEHPSTQGVQGCFTVETKATGTFGTVPAVARADCN